MQKNQVKIYDTLISLIVLFTFLGLLSFRMAWKIDYRFNNELVDVCDTAVTKFKSLYPETVKGKKYRAYDNAYFEEMNYCYACVDSIKVAIEEGKITVRSDYEYAVNQVREDIIILKDDSYFTMYGDTIVEEEFRDMDNKKVAAYNDLKGLVNWHRTYIVFGIIFSIMTVSLTIIKIIKVIKIKKSKQNAIN